MENHSVNKEPIFEKPIKIILILIFIVTIGLVVEAFINNNNAKEIRKNLLYFESRE